MQREKPNQEGCHDPNDTKSRVGPCPSIKHICVDDPVGVAFLFLFAMIMW